MNRLEGKTAIVTGAARGMGRSIAELFAAEGARVLATDVIEADAFDGDVTFAHLDVADEEQWAAIGARLEADFGGVDILVNNAGVIAYEGIDAMSVAVWTREIGINLTGVFLGMRTVVPLMRRAGGGSIVNTSSIWGIAAVPGAAAYHASKGGVRTLTKNAAVSYAADGIRANSVHPGHIATPLTLSQDPALNAVVVGKTPLGRAGQPVEVAQGVLFLASDDASYITGAELVIDGGYLAQ